MSNRIKGVLSPVVTPFAEDSTVDLARFTTQCKWLQANQIGLAFLGTNSEANSISPDERIAMIDAVIDAGLDPSGMMPGTGSCDLPTTVRLTRHAVDRGCAGVLMLPPFYYKGVSDEGLYRYFSEVIQQVGDERLNIYLYHIPPVAQVSITLPLIERLLKSYPSVVAGVKDSSGDWNNTQAMLTHFAPEGFDVFAGSETFLLRTLRGGGAGCISATANVNAPAIHALYKSWQEPDADSQQQALDKIRQIFQQYPMIPALKSAIAHWSTTSSWTRVRPPLVELDSQQHQGLIQQLEAAGFSITGLET
ncbi:dihydrodipicolinate synthase family protein [Advenella mimigardefordensis]|uniref:Dihydrodipicolinate synthase n=1 Tax=Advenella mimigardefordensis (strain DSM 17166 / LMG 22922 / DPN7) TaxID=1247726 RepID=W0P7Q5_ADVMD|nr:dihydrodipicolinate synthase [Advenella mimigardefordensis DPN7]